MQASEFKNTDGVCGTCRAMAPAPQCHDTLAQSLGETWLPSREHEHQGTQNYRISCTETISIFSFYPES